MEAQIAEGQRNAREKLLDNFDQEVVERVRVQTHTVLDRFNEQLWRLTRHLLLYSFYCTMHQPAMSRQILVLPPTAP